MPTTNIKIRVSSLIITILENDCHAFGFMKNGEPNKNGLISKLLPTLVELRKYRRERIIDIIKNDYQRKNADEYCNLINYIIDDVYFNDEELRLLEEDLIIRPTEETICIFDEISNSEIKITAQCKAEYIRGLLNEYARLPQYKREALVFDRELELFNSAVEKKNVIIYRENDEPCRVICFGYIYGISYDQENYFIVYDLLKNVIRAVPVCRAKKIRVLQEHKKTSEYLIRKVDEYSAEMAFDKEWLVEGEYVF